MTDEAGGKADAAELLLDDREWGVKEPETGAALSIYMGYLEAGLRHMGDYTVTGVAFSGPPDAISISAEAAYLGGTIKGQKTRHWDDVTIADLVRTIAAEHRLAPVVSTAFAHVFFDYIAQTAESDMHLLTRIGKDHDAIVAAKARRLLFTTMGEGLTATGAPIPERTISRRDMMRYRLTRVDRGEHSSVVAAYHDVRAGQKQEVTVCSGEPARRLRHVYSSKPNAERAARGDIDRQKRAGAKLSITLPGDPLLVAERPIMVIDHRAAYNGRWSITAVKHEIGASGFTSGVEAEKPAPDPATSAE